MIITNEGIEMNIITRVEIVWSIHVFFFKPAKIPSIIPKGTEIKTAIMLTEKETGSLSIMIWKALALGSITVESPQSPWNMPFNQAIY